MTFNNSELYTEKQKPLLAEWFLLCMQIINRIVSL